MDTQTQAVQTTCMDTNTKTIEDLLVQARDITTKTLGRSPDAIVAEVFRQLCMEREYGLMQEEDPPAPLPLH